MRVFTVFGPSQSGKSTLAEALASLEGRADKKFEVGGVAAVHCFPFMDEEWTAIDVAGGAENLSTLGPALAGSDAAILCAPADAEAAVLSAPFLRLAQEAGLPTLIFINGTDKAASRISEIVAALQSYCTHHVVLRQIPLRSGDEIVGAVDLISERAWKYQEGQPSSLIELPADALDREQGARTELLESLADFDDALLEQLIEDQQPMTDDVYRVASETLQHSDLVPAVIGSALHRNGILRLMKLLRHEAPQADAARARLSADAAAVGLTADVVKHLGKTVLVRAFEPGLGAAERLGGSTIGSITDVDAKSQIRSLDAGDICLTIKSDHLGLGRYYTRDDAHPLPDWAMVHSPAYRRVVTTVHDKDETRFSAALDRLSEIDPGFTVDHDEVSGQIILNTQGPLHLRRLMQKLADDFGIELEHGQVPLSLRETIRSPLEWHHRHRKQTGGAGQFADVVIDVKPVSRGDGFAFGDEVKGGTVPRNYIPAVEQGVRDALEQGPNGFPVVDIAVVLKDGKAHSVDSSDFAFRTAGKNAVKEALAKAGTRTLQPIMRVRIHVPSVFSGGLVPTVSGIKGQVLGFDGHPSAAGWDVFDCLLPMAALDNLYNTLASATRGTAWFTSGFDHYEEVRQEDVAAFENGRMARA